MRGTVAGLFLLLAFALAPAVAAQPFATPPPAGAPRPAGIPVPFEETLPNGLRVVVAQRGGLPLVTAKLLIRSGSEADPAQLAGLADLTATLVTKGTKRRTAPQIADAAEALGGQLASGAAWHRSSVAITVTRPQLPAALELIADVTLHPQFAAAELERARRIALDELNVAMAQPGSLSRMAAARVAFGESTYGHRAGGTPASLSRIRRADIARLHDALYRPDNVTLIFAGDIAPEEAMRLAVATFGSWERPARALNVPAVTAAQPGARSPVVIDMPGSGQAGVVIAASSIARDAPDYYPGVVANALLGGGYSSRLMQEIRIKRGLSYATGSSLDARRLGGLFIAAAQTKNASAGEVAQLMQEEIAKVRDAPAGTDELEARKASLIGDFSRSLETTDGLAAQIAVLEADGVGLPEIRRIIERVSEVTPPAAQEFARTHWRTESLRMVVAGDVAQFGNAALVQRPGAVVIPQKEIDLDQPALVKAEAMQRR